jgi:hypothetical protein
MRWGHRLWPMEDPLVDNIVDNVENTQPLGPLRPAL